MVTYFEIPASNYTATPTGWMPDMLEIEDIASMSVGGSGDAVWRLRVLSGHLDNVRASLTLTRMDRISAPAPWPVGVTAEVAGRTVSWVHEAQAVNGAVFQYRAHFLAPLAGSFAFIYRLEADQLAVPAEVIRYVTVNA
jgi:hypothetical protein